MKLTKRRIGQIAAAMLILVCFTGYCAISESYRNDIKQEEKQRQKAEEEQIALAKQEKERQQAEEQKRLRTHQDQLWQEAKQWPKPVTPLNSSSTQPLLLHLSDTELIYVVQDTLRYELRDSVSSNLYTFSHPQMLYLWSDDQTMLIGGVPQDTPEDATPSTYPWYSLQLSEHKKAVFVNQENVSLNPAEVRSVAAAAKSDTFYLQTAIHETPRYVLLTAGLQLMEMFSIPGPEEIQGSKSPMLPASSVIRRFAQEETTLYGNHIVTIFQDGKEVIVFQQSPVATVARLPGTRYIGKTEVSTVTFSLFAGFKLKRDGDETYVFFPGEDRLLAWDERLEEKGWMVSRESAPYWFYRNKAGAELETLSLADRRYRKWSLDGLTYKRITGDRMEWIDADQQIVPVSLRDLMNSAQAETSIRDIGLLADLEEQLVPVPDGGTAIQVKDEATRKINLPVYPRDKVVLSASSAGISPPQGLVNELELLANQGSGDSVTSTTLYNDKGDWFVLQSERLSRYTPQNEPGQKLVPLGYPAIETNCTTTNYASCVTVDSFLRIGGYWYFPDTYGNRVLKLDEKLQLVSEAPALRPTQLRVVEKNRLSVGTLSGQMTYDLELGLFGQAKATLQPVKAVTGPAGQQPQAVASEIPAVSYYQDKTTGLEWYAVNGRLYQYRQADGQFRSFLIGQPVNGYGEIRILPYKGEVLVFSDTQMLKFRKDNGDFSQVMDYERAQPDAIYDNTSHGENSYVLDEERGLLYLVQGYRILELSLNRGEVRTLFRQDYADIGNIVLDKEKLVFTLNPGGQWNPGLSENDPFNELVRYSLQTGLSERYRLPNNLISLKLEENMLILQEFDNMRKPQRLRQLPLDRLP